MAGWYVTTKKADFQAIAEHYAISPILARLLRNRDLTSYEEMDLFLKGTMEDLHDPHLMQDMDQAVQIILQAVEDHLKLRIVGDYDIDGVCASYILVTGLKRCGADVDVKLPDRIKDGYGINNAIVDQAEVDGIDLIVTCDNGIAAYKQLKRAGQYGIRVVVTDHHEVPYELTEAGEKEYRLPPVCAVVDPHRENCAYPFKGICGAVVAYKLVRVLYEQKGIKEDPEDGFLEFAAFATVGDVMELKDENRILVKYGLEQMKETKNVGLKALIDAVGIDRSKLSPYHIGYILGPCINATGRLDSADRALSLFTTRSREDALRIAAELKSLNDSRKDLTEKYQKLALEQVEQYICTDQVLVLYLPECHESLAGIIAGRVKERYYRPCFVLTGSGEGVKGSGRSIEAYSMYDEMTKCSDLFSKFGGHKMAAGLSMRESEIETFRKRLNEQTTLTKEELCERVQIDIPMPITYATKQLISELSLLEPYGNGNPRPLFAQKNIQILSCRVIGKNQNAVRLSLQNEEQVRMDAIWFGDAEGFVKEMENHGGTHSVMSIAYTPELNVYMGRESVQLQIRNYIFND